MGRSVLDDLGEEVTGIVAPVSMCMAITVILVRLLNPEGKSDSNAVYLATSFYVESEGDSTGQRLSGSIINAVIFVGIVALMTFVLVLLFKYGYTKVIYAYMGFSGFMIFFVLTGIITLKLLQKANVHMDVISFCYILFNFAVVGALSLFMLPAPLFMKQGYLIVTGVAVAYVFTWIPEWTTWILLLAMAVYDIGAVLMPGGPLKVLVELAQEREEQIPALVYEARPTRRDGAGYTERLEAQRAAGLAGQGMEEDALQQPSPLSHYGPSQRQQQPEVELQNGGGWSRAESHHREQQQQQDILHPTFAANSEDDEHAEAPHEPLIGSSRPLSSSSSAAIEAYLSQRPSSAPVARGGHSQQGEQGESGVQHSTGSMPAGLSPPLRVGAGTHLTLEEAAQLAAHPDDASLFGLPESIKLGLGDFIFYSVLVGRAAMYDMLTVFACYLAIIAGLGCTLLLLAVAHKALPALPISIALAVAFYFVARFVMEPVILPMTLQMVYF